MVCIVVNLLPICSWQMTDVLFQVPAPVCNMRCIQLTCRCELAYFQAWQHVEQMVQIFNYIFFFCKLHRIIVYTAVNLEPIFLADQRCPICRQPTEPTV